MYSHLQSTVNFYCTVGDWNCLPEQTVPASSHEPFMVCLHLPQGWGTPVALALNMLSSKHLIALFAQPTWPLHNIPPPADVSFYIKPHIMSLMHRVWSCNRCWCVCWMFRCSAYSVQQVVERTGVHRVWFCNRCWCQLLLYSGRLKLPSWADCPRICSHTVAVHMYQHNALTLKELQSIQSMRDRPVQAAETLLNIIMEQPDAVYLCLLDVLKHTESHHVYQTLVDAGYKG